MITTRKKQEKQLDDKLNFKEEELAKNPRILIDPCYGIDAMLS